MKKLMFFLATWLAAEPALAQVKCNVGLQPLDAKAESRITAMDFLHDVSANEVAFSKAFTAFDYTLDVSMQTLTGDTVDGEYHQVSRVGRDEKGARRIAEIQPTINTLTRVKLPTRDVDALHDTFSITPDILADRDVVYSGRQKLDTFNSAAFDIVPRNDKAGARSFMGRVWVRTRDNAIARICGRVPGNPFGPMRFLVERIKVGEKYWFPAQIQADEDVKSDNSDVRVRITVKYSDYAPH